MSSNSHPLAKPPVLVRGSGSTWMLGIRAGAVVGQTMLFGLVHEYPGQQMPLLLLAGYVAVIAAASMLGLQHARREERLDDSVMFRQVLVDLGVLTYMLAISGGPQNPFHDAYFLPVAVAAASLPPRHTWFVVVASLVCYTVVQFVYLPLPGEPEEVERMVGPGEWATHAALASLAAYFLLRITGSLRERERRLSLAREAAARAESAILIGSVAAGAAHELSTPLMTISAALDDLQAQQHAHPEMRRSLELLRGGVTECIRTLDVLRQSGGSRAHWQERMAVRASVAHLLDRFQCMRPGVMVATQFEGNQPEPSIVADLALQQAVINLLGNAASVSPQWVALHVGWTTTELTIRVTDRGPGLARGLVDRIGRGEFVSTKSSGHGLGLFLTDVTARRLGGRFDIRNAPGCGAIAEICIPLAALQTIGSE